MTLTELSGFDSFDHLGFAEIELHFSPKGPEEAVPGTCQFERAHIQWQDDNIFVSSVTPLVISL